MAPKWSSWVTSTHDIGDRLIFSPSGRMAEVEEVIITRKRDQKPEVKYKMKTEIYNAEHNSSSTFYFFATDAELEEYH